MISKFKTWYRAHRLAGAKRVLLRHYAEQARAYGLTLAQTHQMMVNGLRAIADEALCASRLDGLRLPVAGASPRPPTDEELRMQKASFVRGQLAFGSDADEARERQAYAARLDAARNTPKGDFQ